MWPIGVFASIGSGLGVQLDVVKELGIHSVQLCCPHKESRTAANAEAFLKKLAEIDVTISVVFCDFKGESYADIPTVKRTIGIVPRETREERVKEIREIADFAKILGCDAVGFHIGFIPHDTSDPDYAELLGIMRDLADYLKLNGQRFHLETGQETADGLFGFLTDLERDNVFVNFDPANMILYGSGEPIPALRRVGKWVKSCHCKDATWSDQPGVTWGREVAFGTGQVDGKLFLQTLKEIGYDGPLTIEREIPQDAERQKAEISQAMRFIEGVKAEIL